MRLGSDEQHRAVRYAIHTIPSGLMTAMGREGWENHHLLVRAPVGAGVPTTKGGEFRNESSAWSELLLLYNTSLHCHTLPHPSPPKKRNG